MIKQSNNLSYKLLNAKENLFCIIFLSITIFMILIWLLTFIDVKQHSNPSEIFNKNATSVVEVKAYTENVGESFGTAVILTNDGTLVTNAHVVTYSLINQIYPFDLISIRFASDDSYIYVSLIKYDVIQDIAILSLDESLCNFKPAETSDSSKIKHGDNSTKKGVWELVIDPVSKK